MGMRYLIKPDKHTSCEGQFPLELSFFFEQMDGYGDKSEVAQVAALLNTDLSGFKRRHYGTSTVDEEVRMWEDVDSFTELISSFITKLILKPDYYKSVRYNVNQRKQDEQLVTLGISDSGKFLELLEEFQSLPDYGYPSDYGYLSSGRILKDLADLKNLLLCYKKNGVKKVKVYFM
jgi:hypothetical protein